MAGPGAATVRSQRLFNSVVVGAVAMRENLSFSNGVIHTAHSGVRATLRLPAA